MGLAFEHKTSVLYHLEEQGYERKQLDKSKYGYTLSKTYTETGTTVVYMSRGGVKRFFSWTQLFRIPDDCFLVITKEGRKTLKILEKKKQMSVGNIDTKLCLGPYFIEEYQELIGPDVKVEYAFCLCDFLKAEYLSDSKKWKTLRCINKRHGITVLFGENPNYFEKLKEWIFM